MKKNNSFLINTVIIGVISLLLIFNTAFAQSGGDENKVDKRPVRSPFESGLLIDNPTIVNSPKGSFGLMIKHRFGTIQNGWEDIYGIYAPSNIYMGLTYSITDKLSVGFATEKNNKLQEFYLKWTILDQTRSNSSPLAISYYGNFAINANKKVTLGVDDKFTNRMSYFNQIIIARKFTDKLSLQFAPSYSHFNSVDTIYEHDVIGISVGGRYKLWNDNSFIIDYSYPIPVKEFRNPDMEPKPNLAFGLEFSTSTHAFQVFIASFDQLVSQRNYVYNQHEFNKEGLLVGFNILVRLN